MENKTKEITQPVENPISNLGHIKYLCYLYFELSGANLELELDDIKHLLDTVRTIKLLTQRMYPNKGEYTKEINRILLSAQDPDPVSIVERLNRKIDRQGSEYSFREKEKLKKEIVAIFSAKHDNMPFTVISLTYLLNLTKVLNSYWRIPDYKLEALLNELEEKIEKSDEISFETRKELSAAFENRLWRLRHYLNSYFFNDEVETLSYKYPKKMSKLGIELYAAADTKNFTSATLESEAYMLCTYLFHRYVATNKPDCTHNGWVIEVYDCVLEKFNINMGKFTDYVLLAYSEAFHIMFYNKSTCDITSFTLKNNTWDYTEDEQSSSHPAIEDNSIIKLFLAAFHRMTDLQLIDDRRRRQTRVDYCEFIFAHYVEYPNISMTQAYEKQKNYYKNSGCGSKIFKNATMSNSIVSVSDKLRKAKKVFQSCLCESILSYCQRGIYFHFHPASEKFK